MNSKIKKFDQYVNEADGSRIEKSETPKSVADLIDNYVASNHPSGLVLVCINLSDPARDLMHGGLEIIIEPSEEEIEEMVKIGYYDCELYENGEKVHNWY